MEGSGVSNPSSLTDQGLFGAYGVEMVSGLAGFGDVGRATVNHVPVFAGVALLDLSVPFFCEFEDQSTTRVGSHMVYSLHTSAAPVH